MWRFSSAATSAASSTTGPREVLIRKAVGFILNYAHVKTLGAARQCPADAPEAEQTKRLAPDVGAAELVEVPSAPLAGARQAVALEHAPGYRHDQRPAKVGGGLIEHARRIA